MKLISIWPRQKKFESCLLWLCALPRWVIGYCKIRTILVVVQKQNQWTRFPSTCFPSRIASGTGILTASLDWLVRWIVCVLYNWSVTLQLFYDAQLVGKITSRFSLFGTKQEGAKEIESTQLLSYALSFLRKCANLAIGKTRFGDWHLLLLKKYLRARLSMEWRKTKTKVTAWLFSTLIWRLLRIKN